MSEGVSGDPCIIEAERLRQLGRYGDALLALRKIKVSRTNRLSVEILHAELLERVGQSRESRAILESLSRSRDLSPSQRSVCAFTMGLTDWDLGDTESAIAQFQRAIAHARTAKDLLRTCWAQLRLLVSVAGRSGPQSALLLLAEARRNIVRLGEAQVSAALHILVGEIEAKQGRTDSARRHTRLGQRLMGACPHAWLGALAENNLAAVALMSGDFHVGQEHAYRAVHLAEQSGAIAVRRASLSNLGNLVWLAGDFERAISLFQKAHLLSPAHNEFSNGTLDSLARAYIVEGDYQAADQCLTQIDEAVQTPVDRLLYGNRYAQLTRGLLRLRQGRLNEALQSVDEVRSLASQSGDRILAVWGETLAAEVLLALNRGDDARKSLRAVVELLPCQSPETHAQYERALAFGLTREGKTEQGLPHFDRARRICRGLRNAPGELELERSWNAALPKTRPANACDFAVGATGIGRSLQNIAGLLLHAGRPELLAIELVAILDNLDGIVSAAATSRAADGASETLATFAAAAPAGGPTIQQTFAIGTARNRAVQVEVAIHDDLESIAVLNAVTLLLGVVRDLERARAEREERLTLWPLEDQPPDGDDTVVMGRLSEVMTFARRVATTTAGVLITGESGTGKEILARAIHRYSARADKPFVPFNCAAIPREMLESQLFGHRRGAFTGADRDNPGVIRAAKDGTLLLDEVGDLSPELQPKLLRFLESGEICPLGEPHPITVDVRVIASTNANLEQLVQAGRFREDLYYRLNVIRLSIPPLRERRDELPALVHHFVAKAAREFGKTRIRVAEETMEHLLLYPWPGNVRQLNNELRRMVALADSDTTLTPATLTPEILRATPKASALNGSPEISVPLTEKLVPTLWRIEREMIKAALNSNEGKVDAAARALGISRKGLYLKRQRLGL